MDTPILSVVIPAFNGAETIEQTLSSVLSQSGVDFEVVISDQNSTDGMREKIEPFLADPRVRIIDGPEEPGAESNWNHVTQAARGTFIKLLCQDDLILEGVLERQVRILETHPTVVLTACRRNVVSSTGRSISKNRGLTSFRNVTPGRDAIAKVIKQGANVFGEPACVMMKREDLLAVGGWDASFPYVIDLDGYLKVLRRGDFAPDLETGAVFRVSPRQWSVALRARQASDFSGLMRKQILINDPHIGRVSRAMGSTRAKWNEFRRRVLYFALRRIDRNGFEL